jgi:hypothetical protein
MFIFAHHNKVFMSFLLPEYYYEEHAADALASVASHFHPPHFTFAAHFCACFLTLFLLPSSLYRRGRKRFAAGLLRYALWACCAFTGLCGGLSFMYFFVEMICDVDIYKSFKSICS